MNNNSKKTRTCFICGKRHAIDQLCPIVNEKLINSQKQNQAYCLANIILKCIENNIYFSNILMEIAEIEEYKERKERIDSYHSGYCFKSIQLNDYIQYMAYASNCDFGFLYRSKGKTLIHYYKILDSFLEDAEVFISNNSINISYSIKECCYNDKLRHLNGIFYLTKCIQKNNEISYTLEYKWLFENEFMNRDTNPIEVHHSKDNREFYAYDRNIYEWVDNGTESAYSVKLFSEKDGLLKQLFEEQYKNDWIRDHLVLEKCYDSPFSESWLEKLEKGVYYHLLKWHKLDKNTYQTTYENSIISIIINEDSYYGDCERIYIYSNNDIGIGIGRKFILTDMFDSDWHKNLVPLHRRDSEDNEFRKNNMGDSDTIGEDSINYTQLFHSEQRYDRYDSEGNKLTENDNGEHNTRILDLVDLIDTQLITNNYENYWNNQKTHQIEFTNIIVAKDSLTCQDRTHYIRSVRAIIQLLTKENKIIDYEIYAAYCSECRLYFIFKDDYNKMILHGTPLCKVFFNQNEVSNDNRGFQYKSQSILNAMGYTVDKNINLTFEERKKILEKAIDDELFEIYDVLLYLKWLIRTRETQKKYEAAVAKWREDFNYIQNYKKDSRIQELPEEIKIRY